MLKANSKKQEIDLSFIESHSYEKNDLFFEMNALMGELGELSNIIKKEKFYHDFEDYAKIIDKQQSDGRPTFNEQKLDEAGDILFYFIKVLNKMNIKLEDVVAYQKFKLTEQSKWKGHIFKK